MISRKVISSEMEARIRVSVRKMLVELFETDDWINYSDFFWPERGDELVEDAVVTCVELIADSSRFTEEQIGE